jgi:hypothetical protein
MDPLRRRMFVALPAIALFAQELAQGQETPAPDSEATAKQLGTTLIALVTFEVNRRGGQLAPDAVKEVNSVVNDGVDRLTKQKQLFNTFSISVAIDNARRFGNEIVNEAIQRKADLKKIGADIIKATHDRLCPMYPFC